MVILARIVIPACIVISAGVVILGQAATQAGDDDAPRSVR
jgi:hypothetical protein